MAEYTYNIGNLIQSYENYLIETFHLLWESVEIESDKLEAYTVIGGLLSRQVTLSIELARSPTIWNGHSAPLFLRAMTDLCIAFGWILGDIEERSKKYIMHGLGDEKLLMEQYLQEAEEKPESPNAEKMKKIAEMKKEWINYQRRDFFVEVNLGNWAQLDYRTMANEAGLESLYKFAYKPFSHVAHNMWPHVSRYNCKVCENPLHQYHLVPALFDTEIDADYLFRSCKYVHRAYEALIKKFKIKHDFPLPIEWWHEYFQSQKIEPTDETDELSL